MNALALAALLAFTAPQDASKLLIEDGARFTTQRTVTLTFRLAPADPSPIEMALSSDGVKWSPWRPFAATTKFDLPEGDGEKSVFVRMSDGAGKELSPLFAVIRLDTVAPKPDVTVPHKVPGNLVTLTSNVPDAVAMQFAGENGPWTGWEPYARPRTVVIPPGDGPKLVQVRYRDEAGNISEAAQVRFEVDSTVPPDDKPGVQDARIVVAVEREEALAMQLDVAARGMAETEVLLEGESFLTRREFSPTIDMSIPKTGLPHRITLRMWDADKKEHVAELSFLEQHLPYPPPAEAPPPVPTVEARVGVGLWMNGLSFDAATPFGRRQLKSGAMGTIQLAVALNVLSPVYVEVSGEYATGGDASITTFGADVGVRLYRGELLFDDVQVLAHAGVLLSALDVDDSFFGDFDRGTGFRVGVSARVALTERLFLDGGLEYRHLSYKYSDAVLSGDDKATAGGVALLIGLSWGF
jgi:hypothetical protein